MQLDILRDYSSHLRPNRCNHRKHSKGSIARNLPFESTVAGTLDGLVRMRNNTRNRLACRRHRYPNRLGHSGNHRRPCPRGTKKHSLRQQMVRLKVGDLSLEPLQVRHSLNRLGNPKPWLHCSLQGYLEACHYRNLQLLDLYHRLLPGN